MNNFKTTRRKFLKGTAAGTGLALSGIAPSFSAPGVSAPGTLVKPLQVTRSDKALVYIMLDGGNDSFNMLVPRSGQAYAEYNETRANLALAQSDLLELNLAADGMGREFGLHPAMTEVQSLFNQNKLSFIANIGPMIRPITKTQFFNSPDALPLGLLSHADQFKHWQSARPDIRINRGWLGYIADSLQPNRAESEVPLSISLAGNNIAQNGRISNAYAITDKGSVGLIVNETRNELNDEILASFEQMLNTSFADDPFKDTYISETREAQLLHDKYKNATASVSFSTQFSATPLSQELAEVARSIKAANALGLPQQTFFIRYIGWDHHDELLNSHGQMLAILSRALGEFQAALTELDIADKVVTFTGSDFGRTLTSNGNGTDHGWGGNTLVMGEPVNGGQVFGDYPSLKLGETNPLDVGDGVLMPTTPTDLLFAELAQWFGVAQQDLTTLFPLLRNFSSAGNLPDFLGVINAAQNRRQFSTN